MSSKIVLAVALALAISYAIPASAGPRTCGHSTMQYDSSGTWTVVTNHAPRSATQHSANVE